MTTPKDLLANSSNLQTVSGIYIIFCTQNERAYIGSSLNVKERITTHKNDLNKDQHHCFHLQAAFNKYGKENFVYKLLEIVEEPTKQKLIDYENKYLLQVERVLLFNIQVPATLSYQVPKGTNTGRKWTPEHRKAASEKAKAFGVAHLFTPEVRAKNLAGVKATRGRPKNGKEEHPSSKVSLELAQKIKAEYDSIVKPGQIVRGVQQALMKKYGFSRSLITNICSGRHWSNPDFKWTYNRKDRREEGVKRIISEVPFHCEVTLEQCNIIKEEYKEIFQKESRGRQRISGLTKRLGEKHGINKNLVEKIVYGRHWSNPDWVSYRKREEKVVKIYPSQELQLKVKARYEEIKERAGLDKVAGINKNLQKEFGLSKQEIIYCLKKTREISS